MDFEYAVSKGMLHKERRCVLALRVSSWLGSGIYECATTVTFLIVEPGWTNCSSHRINPCYGLPAPHMHEDMLRRCCCSAQRSSESGSASCVSYIGGETLIRMEFFSSQERSGSENAASPQTLVHTMHATLLSQTL